MNFDKFHEIEEVWLFPRSVLKWRELKEVLKNAGLKYYDDRFTLLRKGRVPVWQSRSIVDVSFFLNEREIFDPECPGAAWDRLRLSYLLATLPPQFVATYVEVVFSVAAQLQADVFSRGKLIGEAELQEMLAKSMEEVEQILGRPGTEEVAIQIEMTYPRSPAKAHKEPEP